MHAANLDRVFLFHKPSSVPIKTKKFTWCTQKAQIKHFNSSSKFPVTVLTWHCQTLRVMIEYLLKMRMRETCEHMAALEMSLHHYEASYVELREIQNFNHLLCKRPKALKREFYAVTCKLSLSKRFCSAREKL